MPLTPGTRLGPYEIGAPLGKGGMGEVYRAKDTGLDRDVAIKVLPNALAGDPERLARFEREAKVLASLNHPNIATIYGLEKSPEGNAIAMELVDGEALKPPIALDAALDYARQIAEALESAHERGIVHRDLKPANIMITPMGVVKVLDFGLAAVAQPSASSSSDPSHSPTLTMAATQAGVIMGTAGYMSPEQAAGQKVDKRADIWSFGVVLWEMLTQKRLFSGETVSHILAAVLRGEIDFSQLPAQTPGTIRTLLRRCLDRDVKTRLRDIGEARIAIGDSRKVVEDKGRPTQHSRMGWVAAAIAAALAVGSVWYFRQAEKPPHLLKVSVLPPEKVGLYADIPAVSPDGQRIAFAGAVDGKIGLWVRDLGSLEARALPGTEGANLPFWSPDGRFLGFFASGKLKKTEATGGPVVSLCNAPDGRGGTWNRDDVIVFASEIISPLFRVPAAGGTPAPVTTISEQEPGHRYPWFLPDGRHFLYTAYGPNPEKDTVYVADLQSKDRRAVMPAASNVVYAAGYVLFLRESTLMAQPFDVGKLQTSGDAVPVAEHVGSTAIDIRAYFSSSGSGVLAYDSPSTVSQFGYSQLTWIDRSGKVSGIVGPPGSLAGAAVSGDGNSVTVSRLDPQSGLFDVWLYNLERRTNSRFTFNSQNNLWPFWSSDGSHIVFYSSPGGSSTVYQKATSGAGKDEILDKSTGVRSAVDRSNDGRYLIEQAIGDSQTGYDIWVLPLFGGKKPLPYLQTNANESSPRLSPNGQWLAYQSDETKRNEIYLTTFPQPGGRWQVSANGGSTPVWSRDGKELFYIGADGKMNAVEVKVGPKFDAGVPRTLFDVHMTGGLNGTFYDVGKDGRFLIPVPAVPAGQGGTEPITVVVNWTVGLKK